jgi:hypothetical protein
MAGFFPKRYGIILTRRQNRLNSVMPDLIRHPLTTWIPAFAGMTTVGYLIAGLITDPECILKSMQRDFLAKFIDIRIRHI